MDTHIDVLRCIAIVFYGFTGALSLGVLGLYAFCWKDYRRKRERLSMALKCVGFILFSLAFGFGNFDRITEPTTWYMWAGLFGISLVNVGWFMRCLDLLMYLKNYPAHIDSKLSDLRHSL